MELKCFSNFCDRILWRLRTSKKCWNLLLLYSSFCIWSLSDIAERVYPVCLKIFATSLGELNNYSFNSYHLQQTTVFTQQLDQKLCTQLDKCFLISCLTNNGIGYVLHFSTKRFNCISTAELLPNWLLNVEIKYVVVVSLQRLQPKSSNFKINRSFPALWRVELFIYALRPETVSTRRLLSYAYLAVLAKMVCVCIYFQEYQL